MAEARALVHLWRQHDAAYFNRNPLRKTHIRNAFQGEHEIEFQSLGYHERNRRRILLCRVDHQGQFLPDNKVLRVPFLAFADETIEDEDRVLLPILAEIMNSKKNEMLQ